MAIEQAYLDQLAADTAPVGRMLAEQVADKLQSGQSLGYSHRYYCATPANTFKNIKKLRTSRIITIYS